MEQMDKASKPMEWTCLQTEERLSDYLEKALTPDELRAFEAHAAGCASCQPMVQMVQHAVARMRELEEMEPPAHLKQRILDSTIGPRKPAREWSGWLQWLRPVLRPQFALGAVAAVLVLGIVLQVVLPTRWKKTALNPQQIYHGVDRQTHLVYARGVKYVNDLRVVYEIESRLHPEPPPAEQPSHPHSSPEQKSEQDATPGHSSNRTYQYVAMNIAPRRSLEFRLVDCAAGFTGEPATGRTL